MSEQIPSPRQDRADPQGQSGDGQPPASSVLTPAVALEVLLSYLPTVAPDDDFADTKVYIRLKDLISGFEMGGKRYRLQEVPPS